MVSSGISTKSVGIDFGVTNFITLSNGKTIKYPNELLRIKKNIRSLAAQLKRSKSRKIMNKLTGYKEVLTLKTVAFLEKTSRELLERYDVICIEDIQKDSLLRRQGHSSQINSLPWRKFISILFILSSYFPNTELILVSAVNTTRKCSKCGNIGKKIPLRMREFNCIACEFTLGRDHNAALNILQDGLNVKKEGSLSRERTRRTGRSK